MFQAQESAGKEDQGKKAVPEGAILSITVILSRYRSALLPLTHGTRAHEDGKSTHHLSSEQPSWRERTLIERIVGMGCYSLRFVMFVYIESSRYSRVLSR